MKHIKWKRPLMVAALLLACIGAASTTVPSPLAAAEIFVFPESTMVAEQSTFQVQIWVSADVMELMGYNIAVTFDETVVEIQSVVEGSLPATSGFTTFFSWLNPTGTDSVHVNGAILGNTVAGAGALFVLHLTAFEVNEDKETPINIVFSDIRNGVNQSISHTTIDGHVKVLDTVPTEQTTWGEIKERYR